MPETLRLQPVQLDAAPAEVRSVLTDLQDTMGIPWPPANWRTYAHFPAAMACMWERLKPVVATERFLSDALTLTELAHREASRWFRPGAVPDLPDQTAREIERELDAFEFGNPQLLLQQAALTHLLAGSGLGQAGDRAPRHRPSRHRSPEIRMIAESQATDAVRDWYADIKRTLGLALVNSDYQALAKWPDFSVPTWDVIKAQLQTPEFGLLREQLAGRADDFARRLGPPMEPIDHVLERVLPPEVTLQAFCRTVDVFTRLLPGLIITIALFRMSLGTRSPFSGSERRAKA